MASASADAAADDEDYALAMRPHGHGAKFRWDASVLSMGAAPVPITPGGLFGIVPPIKVPGLTAGLGYQNFPLDIEWGIWLEAEDNEVQELLGECYIKPKNYKVENP